MPCSPPRGHEATIPRRSHRRLHTDCVAHLRLPFFSRASSRFVSRSAHRLILSVRTITEINTATMMPSGTHVEDVMKFSGSGALGIDALTELQTVDPIPHATSTSFVLGGLHPWRIAARSVVPFRNKASLPAAGKKAGTVQHGRPGWL